MADPKKTKKKALKGKKGAPEKKATEGVVCTLPGAELLEKGMSVDEVMEALEEQKASSLGVDEELFCQEYVSCGIAVRAALRVWPEYSYEYAHVKAGRLMQKDSIKKRIKQLTKEYKERYGLTESKILKRLAALALFDRRTLHKKDGTLKQIHELTEEEAAAIVEVESVELFDGKGKNRTAIGVVRKVKFADPKGSIELAGKNLRLWKEVGTQENPAVQIHKVERIVVKPK